MYNLRTFGINLEGTAEVYCENKSVVTNFIVRVSVLNKRQNNLCYHRVRKAQASGTLRVEWIPGDYNIIMTGNMIHGW